MSEKAKVKKPIYKRWWVIAIAVFLAIGFIGYAFESDESKAERAEEEQAAEDKREADKAAKEDTKQEKESEKQSEADKAERDEQLTNDQRDRAIAGYEEKTANWSEETDGVIVGTDVKFNENHFMVRVFVDETTWAASPESEKESFAVTVSNVVQQSIDAKDSVWVDIVSATNNDVVATQKMFGGWKIKR